MILGISRYLVNSWLAGNCRRVSGGGQTERTESVPGEGVNIIECNSESPYGRVAVGAEN